MSALSEGVDHAPTAIVLGAVAIFGTTIAYSTAVYLGRLTRGAADDTTYKSYRHQLARALLLGLELLVAADIIRTVALEPTLMHVAILGLLVLIRTVLSWGLVVEIEERWPWQPRRAERGPVT